MPLSQFLNPVTAVASYIRARMMNVELAIGGLTKAVSKLERAERLHRVHAVKTENAIDTLNCKIVHHEAQAHAAGTVAGKIRALVTP